MNVNEIATPALLVDRQVAEANSRSMRLKGESSGVRLRPHVKTHKSVELARIQLGSSTGPITVSTLAEAEHFADQGFSDITYAVPFATEKLDRSAALAQRIERLNLLVDHPDTLRAIEEFGRARGQSFDLFLEVDSGSHRSGVDPSAESSFDLAMRMSASKQVRFRGLLTHGGHSYHARNRDEAATIGRDELGAVNGFAAELGRRGIHDLVRSVGSTPTCTALESFEGADEIRPGNYIFFDAFQAAIGSCELRDCAATVLTTVIGLYPEQNRLVLDAGALALSKDAGANHLEGDPGFGVICDLGMRPLPLVIYALSQEHGQARGRGMPLDATIRVGDKLRVIPNHSCLTAAMFDRYHIVEGGTVVDEWRPVRGW